MPNQKLTFGCGESPDSQSIVRIDTPTGPLDTLIGGHALSLDVILVTDNTREFSRIEGLRLEDWIEP
jgi:predicted nucleic acid-binding protein